MKEKTEQSKTAKAIFKAFFTKTSDDLSPSTLEKVKELKQIISQKVDDLLELSKYLEEFQLEVKGLLKDDQTLEFPFLKKELVKNVKLKIECVIFENKNEILGVNLKKEPTFMRIYKLDKTCIEKFEPIRTIALDLTEGVNMDIHFLDHTNSDTHLSLVQQNNIIQKGKANSIK